MKKILLLSDTHGFILPIKGKYDMILHAGDFSPNKYGPRNSFFDAQYQHNWILDEYIPWIKTLETDHFIQIPGNHELICKHESLKKMPWPNNAHYLEDEHLTIDGIKIYGSPWQKWFCDWMFNAPEGDEKELFLQEKYSHIEDDTNIILSHGGVFGYADKTPDGTLTGSRELLKTLDRIKPTLVCTGHIHFDYSTVKYRSTTIVNASIVDEGYEIANEPVIFEI